MANRAPLLLLRPQAGAKRSVQPATEACIHGGNRPGRTVRANGPCRVETGADVLAGVADGGISIGSAVALPDHVGAVGLRVWPPGNGVPAWLEQLCLYGDGMEEGPGLPLGVIASDPALGSVLP